MGVDDLKSPRSMTWEERRDGMRNGAFEGSSAEEKAERALIRSHFHPRMTRKE